ncbi:MAG TPA: hypothetical protein VK177_14535 [Flavobacteriales bacterium]|nr:hypothetical protein [Flavobacteriales bacterium]
MKKLLLLAGLGLFLTVSNASAQKVTTTTTTGTKDSWVASATGIFKGNTVYQYKLNKADGSVQQSENGTTWAAVLDNQWKDKAGKYYKVSGGKLMASDNGKIWAEAPGWSWTGIDNVTYKFDSSWNLMVKK